MTNRIAVYVPTFGRPGKLESVASNVRETTTYPYILIFACETSDIASIQEAVKWGDSFVVNTDDPSYSNSLQLAYESDDSKYFIGANDDFVFEPGWDTEALKVMAEPGVQVVGIHDGNPGCQYSTISLVERAYIEVHSGVIDMPGRVNYPYHHNYVDTEFYCTARHREVFKEAPKSRIRHVHPDFGLASYDKTYMKGRRTFGLDAETFQSRAHLWA